VCARVYLCVRVCVCVCLCVHYHSSAVGDMRWSSSCKLGILPNAPRPVGSDARNLRRGRDIRSLVEPLSPNSPLRMRSSKVFWLDGLPNAGQAIKGRG